MYKILLVDEHPLCRYGVAALLNNESDLRVCGEADSVPVAQQLIQQLKPDLLLMGLKLAEGTGLQLIKQVRARDTKLPILVISMYNELLFAERVVKAGANGYINKADAITNIVPAIRQVLKGHLYLNGAMLEKLLLMQLHNHTDPGAPPESRLSDREMEVFMMLGQGFATKRIALELHVSSKTVDSHKEHIKDKLGITDNTALIQRAVTWMMSK